MSKEDLKQMLLTEEQIFAREITGVPLSQWEKGRPFVAMSQRTLYMFEPTGLSYQDSNSMEGKTLTFEGFESKLTPGLNEECILLFSDGSNTYRYDSGKPTETAMAEVVSNRMPLLSDVVISRQWSERLKGKRLWTKNNLYYDANGNRVPGIRYAEVIVEGVEPSTGDFPMKVRILTSEGERAYINMNYNSETTDSRSFPQVFFLSDPKNRYPQISEENWKSIQKSRVRVGMTKEECRLALGTPDELNGGHNANQTMDIWQYNNGAYLMFTDGLLTRFRL